MRHSMHFLVINKLDVVDNNTAEDIDTASVTDQVKCAVNRRRVKTGELNSWR